jgi:hypothetical protein
MLRGFVNNACFFAFAKASHVLFHLHVCRCGV